MNSFIGTEEAIVSILESTVVCKDTFSINHINEEGGEFTFTPCNSSFLYCLNIEGGIVRAHDRLPPGEERNRLSDEMLFTYEYSSVIIEEGLWVPDNLKVSFSKKFIKINFECRKYLYNTAFFRTRATQNFSVEFDFVTKKVIRNLGTTDSEIISMDIYLTDNIYGFWRTISFLIGRVYDINNRHGLFYSILGRRIGSSYTGNEANLATSYSRTIDLFICTLCEVPLSVYDRIKKGKTKYLTEELLSFSTDELLNTLDIPKSRAILRIVNSKKESVEYIKILLDYNFKVKQIIYLIESGAIQWESTCCRIFFDYLENVPTPILYKLFKGCPNLTPTLMEMDKLLALCGGCVINYNQALLKTLSHLEILKKSIEAKNGLADNSVYTKKLKRCSLSLDYTKDIEEAEVYNDYTYSIVAPLSICKIRAYGVLLCNCLDGRHKEFITNDDILLILKKNKQPLVAIRYNTKKDAITEAEGKNHAALKENEVDIINIALRTRDLPLKKELIL